MQRTFIYDFEPASADPAPGPPIQLDVTQVEDAGLREVLQTPGAAYGAWSILDVLLTPTGPDSPFVLRRPLGAAREVKVALSGLLGRFVARAYLERYFGLSVFAHLGDRTLTLDGLRDVVIERRKEGDLPDRVACTPDLASLVVAEAKGSHEVPDRIGPWLVLGHRPNASMCWSGA